ncbi:hypothetical protein JCM3766R1_000319 [Sporobolomyces carnicolor]
MADSAALDQLRFRTLASKQYLIAWSSLLIWDWLATFPAEVENIWLKKKTPLRVTFLLNRYGTLSLNSATLALILARVSADVCARLYWIERLTLVWVLVMTTALLALRVFTIFDRSRTAGVALSLLVIAQFSVLVAAASFVHPLQMPQELSGYLDTFGCVVADPAGDQAFLALAFFCAPFATTALLLVATIFRRWQIQKEQRGRKSPLLEKMVRDGALYLVCITAVSSLNAYFFIKSNGPFKSMNLCVVVIVSSTLSCRLVLSILAHKPDSTSGIVVSRVSVSRVSDPRPSPLSSRLVGAPTCPIPLSRPPRLEDFERREDSEPAVEPTSSSAKPSKKKGVSFAI